MESRNYDGNKHLASRQYGFYIDPTGFGTRELKDDTIEIRSVCIDRGDRLYVNVTTKFRIKDKFIKKFAYSFIYQLGFHTSYPKDAFF